MCSFDDTIDWEDARLSVQKVAVALSWFVVYLVESVDLQHSFLPLTTLSCLCLL